jgi:hypothetical protein
MTEVGDRPAPPRPVDTPLAERAYESTMRAVDEGLLIAMSAITMVVKNYIIVGTIRRDRSLDELAVPAFTRVHLDEFAREQADNADRTENEATAAAVASGALQHQHDYRPADFVPLMERSRIYRLLSEELERVRDDEVRVARIVEAARDAAWTELGQVIEARLDILAPDEPGNWADGSREERMRAVREVDLAVLNRRFARWQTD